MFFKKKNRNKNHKEPVEKYTTEFLEETKEYLVTVKELDFAIFFEEVLYIHTTPKLNVVSLGYHSARIEDLTERSIEIIEISNLHDTDKDLPEKLITQGNTLLCKNEESLNLFKQTTLQKTTPLKLVK